MLLISLSKISRVYFCDHLLAASDIFRKAVSSFKASLIECNALSQSDSIEIPLFPESSISGTQETDVAIGMVPKNIASATDFCQPSDVEGNIKKWACCNIFVITAFS